jgi:hypothetical protein
MVRTLAEIQANNVMVKITVDDALSTYNSAQVAGALQDYARSASDRENLVRELEKRPTFGALRDAINGKDLALGELQTVRAERDRFKRQAYEENDKAAALRTEVKTLEQSLAARDHLLRESTALVNWVRESVWAAHLDEPMNRRGVESVLKGHADYLASAVAFVRSIVGQP